MGAGIAGLAAAWEAVTTTPGAEVAVHEGDRIGGKIRTAPFGGHPVDEGADAFLTRVPDAVRLCRELGIEDELVSPAAGRALLWTGGSLHPFPDGLVLGVPGRLGPLVGSRLLTPAGLLRAGADLILPRRRWCDDASVADVIGSRFGRQVVDHLVDPLLGGIHAGSTYRLSAPAVAPQLWQAARTHRSLLLALRSAPSPSGEPIFAVPKGGMGRLVERLIDALAERGVTFVFDRVQRLQAGRDSRWEIDASGAYDAVVLATPAAVASRLVIDAFPVAGAELASIRTASIAVVTLAYSADALRVPSGVSGLLVPRADGRLMTACSFGTAKWPHWSESDEMVLRVSVGRDGDERGFALDDEQLVERLHDEVVVALGAKGPPLRWRVSRWPDAFPQYEVGHLARVDRIEVALAKDAPTLAVAGASYRGSGVPACIASGRAAATRVLGAVAPAPGRMP